MCRAFVALLLCLLTACETDNMYSSAYCRFTFNASLYPSSALTRAIGSTGGDFCIVKAQVKNGATHLMLTPNRGTFADTDLDLVMNTAITGERISYAGMGYRQGLIIGRSLYGQLRCYDAMCPNCDHNYPLSWSQAQALDLECSKCHRIYNIDGEYGYVKTGDKGQALTLYRNVSYMPDNGLLMVSNP
ncbi:MAG: hypothetical protein K5683_05190 [Prevotella sp.]|nr:hypothetical protein [Prevotella sp.]